MKSVLDIQVSRFKDYETPDNPVTINLLDWLASTENKEVVERIRSLPTKEARNNLKATLPAITPSGIFTYRSQKCLVKHSGLIQFDVDFAGNNRNISNYNELKGQLCNIVHVAYCGLSVSGTGFWGLIPIAYPEHHKRHFNALKPAFSRLGIELDDKPANVASLRGYSYDSEAYFNHNATPFKGLPAPVIYTPRKNGKGKIATTVNEKIERAKKILERNGSYFVDGNKHQYINNLCIFLCKFGVSIDEAKNYIYSNLLPGNLITTNCIESPYRDFKSEFGTWNK